MLLRTHASKALRCLLPAATSSARAAGSVGASSTAETSVPVAAAAAARLHQRRSASAAGGASDRGQTQSKGGSLSDDAPAAVDPDTGLTYSVPHDRQMRDTVEEVTMCGGHLSEVQHCCWALGCPADVRSPHCAGRTLPAVPALPCQATCFSTSAICSYQLEELLAAKTGIAADPEVRCIQRLQCY